MQSSKDDLENHSNTPGKNKQKEKKQNMRYAICLRGISYYKNYVHDSRPGMTPYDIDFTNCIPFLKQNLVKPLEDKGDIVDFFFLTYDSEKLPMFLADLKPQKASIIKYKPEITATSWTNVASLIIDSAKLAYEFAKENNIIYDYYLITRFDMLFLEKITNVFLEPEGVSVVTYRDDNFYAVSGKIIDKFIAAIEKLRSDGLVTHESTRVLMDSGVCCHCMYPLNFDNNKYPFMRNTRHHINQPSHIYWCCDLDEVFKPDSKWFVFYHQPCLQYNPCY